MLLSAGMQAPDFSLKDENEILRRLSEFRGTPVVLYFYPKDDTPGCTKEACGFRDDYSAYQQAGVVVLGVSPDSPKSHKKFKEKYALPFTLLSDDTHEVCQRYGVWGRKKFMGKEYDGVLRTTFLIDREGVIKRVFEEVSPAHHSQEVLEAIQKTF